MTSHRVLRHRVHLLGGAVLVVLALLLAAPAAQAQELLGTDLSIDKTDDPDPVAVGEELTYTLTAENHGSTESLPISTGATIVDELPGTRPSGSQPWVMFQDASAGCTYNATTHNVTCRTSLLELLLPGQTKTFRIDVIPLPEAPRFITDKATITGNQPETNPGNNTDEEDTEVTGGGNGPGETEAECDGERATVVGTSGTDTNASLAPDGPTEGNDVIALLGGNDNVNGLGGNDRICGNSGVDTLNGGLGIDLVLGGLDGDFLFGDADSDLVRGGADDDQASGGAARDAIGGGSGNDSLSGNAENDALFGADGTDVANGGGGTRDLCRAEQRQNCER